MMEQEEMLVLLDEMLRSHGPIGDEREIDAVLLREFSASGAKTWQDGMSNIYAHIPGDGPRVLVIVHKDELGLIVSDVAEDGVLRVKPLGGARPPEKRERGLDAIAEHRSTLS
ncbi:MAG: hypothetical protein OXB89_08245, partial [Anaerolineaceae bacterium]|nr:hypothetical protein [Anaerolineaceae bacterium]